MSGSLLVDTNIILYFLDGDETLLPVLEENELFVSFITELELLSYTKLSKAETKKVEQFLMSCTILDITSRIKELTINLRKKTTLKLPDSIIIATSLYLDTPFITADTDFKQVEEADLILYEK
ncbi:MAG: type II toxin-antitoxin system VapC family toxin [Balneolales bacterium]